ncbi:MULTISPECIES: DUF397 domain-containing protein [unclassified Actinoplanes]|uniref:DUF397 domain-containing protein n=1 Tax=unclassified Actinoplanes TaxID=2626549 RepID=UPI00030F40D3|nr:MULTISPECIES: DUF397 domain-containing protein [unclassified Actinoplanes]
MNSSTIWFKSSYSGAAGHCVETAFLENNKVGVRDSKNRSGPALIFTAAEWDAFVAGVKANEFDRR